LSITYVDRDLEAVSGSIAIGLATPVGTWIDCVRFESLKPLEVSLFGVTSKESSKIALEIISALPTYAGCLPSPEDSMSVELIIKAWRVRSGLFMVSPLSSGSVALLGSGIAELADMVCCVPVKHDLGDATCLILGRSLPLAHVRLVLHQF
jgi:hypothetical protein